MVHILVVEDDKDLNESVCRYLAQKGYDVTGAYNANEALDCMYEANYDLLISDIMMPEINGFEFAEMIRKQNQNIPIIFMTARDDFSAKEKGYRLGIDDYMVKPIDFNELLLHIGALMRRANITAEKKLVIGSLVLDENEMSVTLNGEEKEFTLREFQILFKLLSYPKQAFTRSQLMDEFSGIEKESGLRTVDVFITNIRTKLADCNDIKIVTVRGLGYKAIINEGVE